MAYLDPAAGSMMLQIILGGIAGLAVALRLYLRRILALFKGRGGRAAASEAPDGA